MDNFRQRRSSFTRSFNQGGGGGSNQEPMIFVEESENCEDEELPSKQSTPRHSLDIDSPVNPYLLSPWRDPRETRKHSLPTQQVTEGITASQVRRLSERGGEGSGPSPKEAEFLATLSQAPQPSGRRHSVVTISKVPLTIFGKGRRESVAAYPIGGRVLGSRRESQTSTGPPATDPIGSIHNLQLDIMDDIVQARKARMKLWNTSSEKVCEVQTLDETGNSSSSKRYTNRRFSDFVCSSLAPIPSHRRASENPTVVPSINSTSSISNNSNNNNNNNNNSKSGATNSSAAQNFFKKTGIVVSNTDLMSIISSLTSSATEINKSTVVETPSSTKSTTKLSPNSNTLLTSDSCAGGSGSGGIGRSNRSNSFDVSILHNAKQVLSGNSNETASSSPFSGWFEKRHQPMVRKKSMNTTVAFSKEILDRFKDKDVVKAKETPKKSKSRLRWDNRGAFVDPHVIGNAIEGFLRKGTSSSSSSSTSKGAVPKESSFTSRYKKATSSKPSTSSSSSSSGFWFTKGDEDDSNDTCDSSLCSTLKDLFVK